MKNKRLWSFMMVMILLFVTLAPISGTMKAATNMKYLGVNQKVLPFNEIVYVDGTNGNDTTGDGSKEKPFATVVKGFDYMSENCRENGAIVVANGVYDVFDLFTGNSYNFNPNYNEMKISILAETMGKVEFKNVQDLTLLEHDVSMRIKLKMYGIIINIPTMNSALVADDWGNEFYNCVINGLYGGFSRYMIAWGHFENTVFAGSPTANYSQFPSTGKAINCASVTSAIEPANGEKISPLTNVTLDTDYNITSSGWENAGTGTNPDGSKAHIGVYGGQFAWGSKVAETEVSVPQTRQLKVVLEPIEELQLSVDEDLSENTRLIWSSSDPAVATVDANGLVIAARKGNTVITVRSADGTYQEEIKVLVVDDAKEYRLAIDLKIGEKCRLTIDDAEDLVGSWTVMDSSIATITNKGRVTAIARGLTIVTAFDENGNEVGQVYVRVR